MHIVAAILTFFICFLFGLYKSSQLKWRKEQLTECERLIEDLIIRLRYDARPVYQLIHEMSDCSDTRFLRALSAELGDEPNFHPHWHAQVNALQINSEEKQILHGIGDKLGSSDLDGQLSMLQAGKLHLHKAITLVEDEYQQKGKMYRTIGALIGLGLAVILI